MLIEFILLLCSFARTIASVNRTSLRLDFFQNTEFPNLVEFKADKKEAHNPWMEFLKGRKEGPVLLSPLGQEVCVLAIDKFENIESMCLPHSRGGYRKIIEF